MSHDPDSFFGIASCTGTGVAVEGDGQGASEGAVVDLREAQTRLERKNRQFDAAINNISHGLCMFDSDGRLIVCNRLYMQMYDLPLVLAEPGTTFRQILDGRIATGNIVDSEAYCRTRAEVHAEGVASEKTLELRDGRVFTVLHHPVAGGGWVSTHEDITERKRTEARIAHMAAHDALTDLPNRALFRERLNEDLARVARARDTSVVLCLDLDRFKAVNDTLGHLVGDSLLRTVAERLRSTARESDTVARLGGDEFAVLMPAARPSDAGALARRAIDVISQPYDVDGHRLNIGLSVGIAVGPRDGDDPDQLLRSADMALYRAKQDGRGTFRFFEAEMDARMQARRVLELDLRQALASGQFELHYQPLITVATARITGFEALIRWKHPTRGLVPPLEFIPLAEEIGLMVPIGEWVVRQACSEAAGWPDDIRIAINLSPVQFKSANLVPSIVSALASSGIAPGRLELEITEGVLLQDNEATLRTLHQLRALGLRISMDDFGTGYSSLSYLRSFPFDKIKIDRSFVTSLDKNTDCASIVHAVAFLGASLGMSTTAEGVETTEEFERLRADGCTEVQGFLFGPPQAATEIARLLGAQAAAWRSNPPGTKDETAQRPSSRLQSTSKSRRSRVRRSLCVNGAARGAPS